MDLRQLAALVAVADEGTFSGAAAALHTVQSNVSTHIRRLEREVGAQLVDRNGCRLTEEGEIVVARARRIQEELDAMVADVGALRSEVKGRARVGVISSTGRWLVPLLLTDVGTKHPHVEVVVVDATTTSLGPQVAAGRLDVAIVNLPCDETDLVAEPLFEEAFVVVVPDDHRLASRRAVGLADLKDVPLLLPPVGTSFRAELDSAAAALGIRLQPLAEIDGVRLIASMVFRGFAPAVLPATAALSWQGGNWRAIALRDMPPREVGLVLRRRGLPSAPTRAVIEVLRVVVTREGGRQPGIRIGRKS